MEFLLASSSGLVGNSLHKALLRAAEENLVEIGARLIAKGANINFVINDTTALRLAVDFGHEDMARMLIQKGALVIEERFNWNFEIRDQTWREFDLLELALHRGNDGILEELRRFSRA